MRLEVTLLHGHRANGADVTVRADDDDLALMLGLQLLHSFVNCPLYEAHVRDSTVVHSMVVVSHT